MGIYEEVLVLHPDSTFEEQKGIYQNSLSVIESFNGCIHTLDTFGSRPLANRGEKKLSRGWYFYMIFSASPKAVAELRRKLRINDRVVYFHHEKLGKKQSPEICRERFLKVLEHSTQREKERQLKMQKRARTAGFQANK